MKNKKVLIITSIVAVVLIVVVLLGVLYFTTDLFKTNQQLFYKYLAQTEIVDSNFIKQYELARDRITANSNSSSVDLSISTVAQNQETGVVDTQQIMNIKSNGLKNTLQKQSYRDFVFSSNDQNFLTLKYIRDDNTYGIIADNILAKYLAVENSNLKDLFFKLGVEDTSSIPDSIPTNYKEILKIDEVTLNKLSETYGTLIYNNVTKERFYKITNEDKTQTIGVSLTQQEVFDLLKIILETVKNDSTLLNLIVSKAQLLNYNNVTIVNIQTELQNYIDNINSNTYLNDKDYLKLSLIKSGKVVAKVIFETYGIETNDNATTYQEDQINPIAEVIKQNIELDFSEANKLNILMKENDLETIKISTNYSYDNNNIDFNIRLESIEGENTNDIEAQYQISNYQTDNISQNLVANISQNKEENYEITLLNNITIKQDVQISKLTTENSAKLNDMTSEELSQLFTALVNRINQLYGEGFENSANIYNAANQSVNDATEVGEEITNEAQNAAQNAINALENIN